MTLGFAIFWKIMSLENQESWFFNGSVWYIFLLSFNGTKLVIQQMFSSKTVFPGHPNMVIMVIPKPSLMMKSLICKRKQENISQQQLPKKKKTSPKNNPNIFKTKNISKISKMKRPQIFPAQVSPALGTLANLIYSADCEASFGGKWWSTSGFNRTISTMVDQIDLIRCKVAKVAWWL